MKTLPNTGDKLEDIYIVNGINNDKIEFVTNYDIRKFNRLIEHIKYRQHGKWLGGGGLFGTKYTCSVCGHWSTYDDNYCPNCGAKMNKGGNNDNMASKQVPK